MPPLRPHRGGGTFPLRCTMTRSEPFTPSRPHSEFLDELKTRYSAVKPEEKAEAERAERQQRTEFNFNELRGLFRD
jgi:hypothetical protein